MKKVIILLLFFFSINSIATMAQNAPKPKKEVFSWQKEYMDEAGISPEVQAKITSLKTEFEAKIKVIRKDDSVGDEEKKEKIKEINKQKSEAIYALLTKEQKEKIKAIKERLKKDE